MLSHGNESFAEGVESGETFPETSSPESEAAAPAPAPASPRRLTVVRDEPAPEPQAEPEPTAEPAVPITTERFDELVRRIDLALQGALDQRIEQRLATFRSEIDRAFASRTAAPAAPAPARTRELPDPVRDAIRAATNARDASRVMRDAVHGFSTTAALAGAL